MAVLKFRQNIADTLTPDEKEMLPYLIRACELTDLVYKYQQDQNKKGGNFFPPNISRHEIEDAAIMDPKILSPYTVVKKTETGKLFSVDYVEQYQSFLLPIIENLEKAAKIAKNRSFKNYLKILTQSLRGGSFLEADIAWLEVKGTNLLLVLGPYERYMDKLFFIKRAFQANLGIVKKDKNKEAKVFRDILFATLPEKENRVKPPVIVDIATVQDIIFAGFIGETKFSEQHLPSDSDTIQLYGSRILIYLSSTERKFESLLYPIFTRIFEKKFKLSYPKELLKRGNYYYVILSAIGQFTNRFRNSKLRLRELFPVFDEANNVLQGITKAKQLLLKGIINQKELEAIMIAEICWAFAEWVLSKKTEVRDDYLKGDALSFTFLFKVGALQEKDGISWPNFAKMFFETENLASFFSDILSDGSYDQAKEFISKYFSVEIFNNFEKRLGKIKQD